MKVRQALGNEDPAWFSASAHLPCFPLLELFPVQFKKSHAPHNHSSLATHSRMSLANRSSGPRATTTSAPKVNDFNSSQIPAKIDLLISLSLHAWPALTLSIQNSWGGPTSNDKRDWFAGAISDLLSSNQVSSVDDLEEVLLQVMLDEFEVVVDDDSPMEVAMKIWKGREKVLKGEFEEVDALWNSWMEKQTKGGPEKLNIQRGEDKEGADTDWDDDDEEEWDGFEDEEMVEAPMLVENKPRREKMEPEIDEEGFTKIVGKKRR